MLEFIDKVDTLCFEYGFQIFPSEDAYNGKRDENGKSETLVVVGDGVVQELFFIDGDGLVD